MVRKGVGNNRDWRCKLCNNVGKCQDDKIMSVSFSFFNDIKEGIDNRIINKGHSSLNEFDWIHQGWLWGWSWPILVQSKFLIRKRVCHWFSLI